jgi:hypothetical protein
MKKFRMKEYRWSLRTQDVKVGYLQNIKNIFITPNIEKHEWKVFSSPKRFLSIIYFIVFVLFSINTI